jgi:hypothetical protein
MAEKFRGANLLAKIASIDFDILVLHGVVLALRVTLRLLEDKPSTHQIGL